MNEPRAERLLNWAGTLNFRDLGGYRTLDGRSTRWRVLYRSGTTHEMLPAEVERVRQLGLRYVFDLRSKTERENNPSPLQTIAGLHYRFADHDEIPGDITRTLRKPQSTAADSRRAMIAVYRQFPLLFKNAYRQLFTSVESGDLPMLVNCSAGKDRTGVAMALLLAALGVSRQIIEEDYRLTEQSFEQCCELFMRGPLAGIFAGTDRSIWEPVLRAEPAYLNAMFDSVYERFDTVDNYVRDGLEISASSLQRIRDHLLE
jgi:protein-tyrosine phosphatase